jgi:hypothetical protein
MEAFLIVWISNGEYLCPGTKSSKSYKDFLIEQLFPLTRSSHRNVSKHAIILFSVTQRQEN